MCNRSDFIYGNHIFVYCVGKMSCTVVCAFLWMINTLIQITIHVCYTFIFNSEQIEGSNQL